MRLLLTGAAGFIGFHTAKKLLDRGDEVIGIDNINDYYDINLKHARLEQIRSTPNKKNFYFSKVDISEPEDLDNIFDNYKPDGVIHLAAQAGVRYSIENPSAYITSNIIGFQNILECCRKSKVDGLIYASSSSVYGGNKKVPFSESDNVDNPISIYAASKKANELMAKTYNHLYNLKSTGLRFFTVYGPWGRPDMAISIFTKKILNGDPIQIFNYGKMQRDFTYIDDIVNGIISALKNNYDFKVYNLGNSKSEKLLNVVSLIENELNKKAIIELAPIQPGDVKKTFANIKKAQTELAFNPKIDINVGIKNFVEWFKNYYSN